MYAARIINIKANGMCAQHALAFLTEYSREKFWSIPGQYISFPG